MEEADHWGLVLSSRTLRTMIADVVESDAGMGAVLGGRGACGLLLLLTG